MEQAVNRREVTFLSAVDASRIETPSNVISIGSKGDWYAFAGGRKCLAWSGAEWISPID